ncbi:hypothetical protein [Rhizobium sp. LCM 4573]|uniref:hypothetical protein n=1 Tax=Rhizobium sp. LCM 4573 TaxID=1848291 RepID=UPI0008DB1A27|nr:hypothetical protein [Rhizobium sp. LCM 4573]OHV78411.1 hypothetical protein LCM4573_26710 [Rhizobium sp. LCM 4573]
MRKWLAGLVIATTLCSAGHAADVPRFKDYPAKIYSGRQASLRLDTAEVQEHRTRLEEAEKESINFGGRYVFTQWGAGTQCDTGALIDVATGQVHVLPFAACFWSGYERPFEVRPNSRLLVVAGQVGEDGPRGAHFFEFTGTEFRKVGMKAEEPIIGADAASVEPSAGPPADVASAPLEKTPEGLNAFTDAVITGVHRINFNDAWRSDLKKFGLPEGEKLARALIETSIKKRYELRSARYVLLYNPSADLYALIKVKNGEKPTVGLMPGRYFSEELYKFKERPNYIENMLKNRPVVFRQIAKDFPRSDVFDNVFSWYQKDEELSQAVKIHLVAFLEFVNAARESGCREAVIAAINGMDIAFADGKRSTQTGPFYLSTVFPVAAAADKPVQLAATFHDKQTNRYGGYAVFMPGGEHKCKVTLVIPTVY